MKVLNRSMLSKPWKTRATCKGDKTIRKKGCGAKLEVLECDLQLFHYFGTHFQHKYLATKCPACGGIIRGFKIPEYVIARWEKKHPRAKSEFDGLDDRI